MTPPEVSLAALRAAAQAGDLATAARLAETLLAAGAGHDPLPQRVLGAWHEANHRLLPAANAFAAALRLERDHLPTLVAYGQVRARLGQLVEAEGALRHAVRLEPDDVGARLALAWTLENRGEVDAALAEYAAAAERDPDAAAARAGAATLCARRGRWAEAIRHAEAVLQRQPDHGPALIARAQAALGQGDPQSAERRLRGWLVRPQAGSAHGRAVATALLGDALHAQGQAAAFAEWTSANAALRTLHAAHYGLDDPATAVAERGLALAQRLLRVPIPAWPEPAIPTAMPAAGHAFVVGFPRSGTTLLGQVLGSHPQVATLDEVELLTAPAARYLGSDTGLAALAEARDADLDGYRRAYWQDAERRVGTLAGKVFVDKLPTYLLGLPLLARLFPDARVIVVRRDPRDVVLSAFRHQFVINPATVECLDLHDAAAFFDAAQAQAARWLAALPITATTVQHEALVADFDGESARLCAFLALDWHPAMRDFAAQSQDRAVRTVSSVQVARGLNRDGIGQWRRYRAPLAPVLPMLDRWVTAWGYPAD